MQPVTEWQNVTSAMFRDEIAPAGQPAVMRGLVTNWPAVAEARQSPASLSSYLKRLDAGRFADLLAGPPSIRGEFFYRDDMRGMNFTRSKQPIVTILDALIANLDQTAPPALSMQGIPAAEAMPGFADENVLPLPEIKVAPRLWIGNKVAVAPHFDLYDNIACVVAGKRRFTIFPPDQLPNLYVGPLDFSPAGAPVSMVKQSESDFVRYPRYREALAAAQVAELEPGDAIYIPYMWWHGVQSLTPFNLLCNYWWNDHRPPAQPFDALMHAFLVFGALPEEQRRIWRGMLDHYVFRTGGDPLAHLPPERRGALGGLDEQGIAAMKWTLAQNLSRA